MRDEGERAQRSSLAAHHRAGRSPHAPGAQIWHGSAARREPRPPQTADEVCRRRSVSTVVDEVDRRASILRCGDDHGMTDSEEDQELIAVAVEALSEIWGLGAEPSAAIARGALDEIERVKQAAERDPR